MSAKWFWQSDSGWIVYSDAMIKTLESGFKAKKKKVKVDDERFVDLEALLQRRYDDESKVRPVKRELDKKGKKKEESEEEEEDEKTTTTTSKTSKPTSSPATTTSDMFDDFVFFFFNAKQADDQIQEQITDQGGLVVSIFNKRVTHIVSDKPIDDEDFKADLDPSVKTVKKAFITDSLKKGKLVSINDYVVASSGSGSGSTSGGKKKRDDEDEEEEEEEDEQPKKKKQKTGADDEESQKAALAARWYWKADSGWIEYSVTLSKQLETAFSSKKKKLDIDDERFVDFVAMTQRRKDDPSKQRPVERKENQNFSSGSSGKKKETILKKGKAPVSKYCNENYKTDWHVLEEGSDVWDCMLNQTNLAQNNNKYYVIQLLEKDHGSGWTVFTAWGRVGNSPQRSNDPFGAKDDAKRAFKKKFREKTGNDWDDRGDFEKKSGKYDLVEMSYGDDESEEEEEKPIPKKAAPAPAPTPAPSSSSKALTSSSSNNSGGKNSKLHQSIQDLIQLICDMKTFQKQLIEMNLDPKKTPLGKLSKKQIKKGYDILKQIEDILDSGKIDKTRLSDCVNQFYTNIPHNFGMKVPPMINDKKILKDKMDMLDSLTDLEIAGKILDIGDDNTGNPIDKHYEQLNVEMKHLDKSDDIFKMVQRYVKDTHAPTHTQYTLEVCNVFEVERPGERQRYESGGWHNNSNRRLLWHGSRLTNWVGILKTGLRIAPPEAPVTGYMFGKGLYFADCSSKSANYCFATKEQPYGLLILCEVALGSYYMKRQAEMISKLQSQFQSTKGEGQMEPDESEIYTMDDGTIVPCGHLKKTGLTQAQTALLYPEYIIYDTAQHVMKYLVKIKFHWK